jgi:CxxC motif-containing protein
MEQRKMICISCPLGCSLEVNILDDDIEIKGNKCKRGEQYGLNEIKDPKRIVTSTIRVLNGKKSLASVKTDKEISKMKMFDIINVINTIQVDAPVKVGDVLIKNIFETGVNIVATSNNDRLS